MPRFLLGAVLLGALLASCIATAPEGIHRRTDTGGEGGDIFGTNSSNTGATTGSSSNNDPHAVLGVVPPHGSFNGGQHVVVHGQGFAPNARVWLGDVEADGVIAIDPTRVQINAPAHAPGVVAVSVQNGDDSSTARSLEDAYTYDYLFAQPDSGPVAGGTVINIHGSGAAWDTEATVDALVDQKPCTTVEVLGPELLGCTVPKGTPGTKSISVVTTTETLTALDAYTYQDSTDGYKGGLGGDPLNGTLKVLAFDNYSGDPLQGAHIIVGSNLNDALVKQADSSGIAQFVDPSLTEPVTVTIAAKCHSPISFVDVPVDSVTAYLNPTLTPQCAGEGDPPPVGGNPTLSGKLKGQLVWETGGEFKKGEWVNVPAPTNANEERVAFVFFASTDPQRNFKLPSPSYEVYEDSPGDLGYGFSVTAYPGNHTLYALAGLRNKVNGNFYAYAFGTVQGVAVFPGKSTQNVIVKMTHSLDQALKMSASPPASGPKGPDRLHATVAVEIAQSRYAIFPNMQKTPFIPLSGTLGFVGLPALNGSLTGGRYIAGAEAVTGPQLAAPLSVVGQIATNSTGQLIVVDGFVNVPQLVTPLPGGPWDGRHLAVGFGDGGFPIDLTVYEISAAGGLARWIVAVPAAAHAIELPDLSSFEEAGLPSSALIIGVYGAHIDDFDYATLGYRQLRSSGMTAYALDYFNAQL